MSLEFHNNLITSFELTVNGEVISLINHYKIVAYSDITSLKITFDTSLIPKEQPPPDKDVPVGSSPDR